MTTPQTPPAPLTFSLGAIPDKIVFGGYTQAQLEAAFNLVRNKENWKYEVDHHFPPGVEIDTDLISAAVAYFTGSGAIFEVTEQGTRVTADGYYATIGS